MHPHASETQNDNAEQMLRYFQARQSPSFEEAAMHFDCQGWNLDQILHAVGLLLEVGKIRTSQMRVEVVEVLV